MYMYLDDERSQRKRLNRCTLFSLYTIKRNRRSVSEGFVKAFLIIFLVNSYVSDCLAATSFEPNLPSDNVKCLVTASNN